ncbi:traB domain-containing protein isoform X1 [Selaginella moellendorffii]|uniref:traB domain-containing protein isoform X1 n=1 Tax=Selaginella moellendorffii TaxID=88036 RepID=UPI000D1C5EE0|nr:traB domain-containing protein isoform X1 [Selaginella moellendorffii]|eukprot:XP_024527844.1 traB domain-containing protein isoform X1 [Selaginella moellendorffii]
MINVAPPRVLAPRSRALSGIPLRALSKSCSISGPPDDFSYREAVSMDTEEIVGTRWPQLIDIVREGSLVAVRNVNAGENGEPELVILVGTAHVSQVSAQQVERAIKTIRPDNVVVELCKSRIGIMYLDPSMANSTANFLSLTGTDRNAALARSFNLGGRSAFFLRLLLASVSEKISKSAAVPVGEEFRAARRAAKEVEAQLVLGDRPIEITLNRAWRALTWKERLRLANTFLQTFLFANVDASEAALKSMKSDDVISSMYSFMSSQFPSLLRHLVWERDLYMAWSLKRSKAVTGCKTVVGVIGRGHLSGVVYALLHSQEHLSFRDLVGKTEDSIADPFRIYRGIIAEGILGLLLWLLYSYISANLAV